MEEKIIESEKYNLKKFLIGILIFAAAATFIVSFVLLRQEVLYYKEHFLRPWHDSPSYDCFYCEHANSTFGWVMYCLFTIPHCFILLGGVAVILLGLIIYWALNSCELVVTDKRVYGKTTFGRRVDLPLDSISAISHKSLTKGVSVATSSGKISFLALKNNDKIYQELNALLVRRQDAKPAPVTPVAPVAATASYNADELLKYKQLLDAGVLTQEEFDAKKKQLLGLQ